jgi:hypothetical protein
MSGASTRRGIGEEGSLGQLDPAASMRRAETIILLTLWIVIAAALRPAMEYLEGMGDRLLWVASALELGLRAALAS